MPFIEIPGLNGKVYSPEHDPGCPKKHGCKECFTCQMCGDDRCEVCLSSKRNIPQNCRNDTHQKQYCTLGPV